MSSGGTLNSNGNLTINTGGEATTDGTWNQNSGLITVAGGVFNLAAGTLTATASGGGITVTSGSLDIAYGGSHTVRNLTRSGSGSVSLSHGSLTVTGTYNNGNTTQSVDGIIATDSPVLTLSGGATSTGLTGLYVGEFRKGTVTVVGGSTLNASTLYVGTQTGGNGTISVSGANSKIQLSGGFTSYVGLEGTGLLSISGSTTASVNTGNGSIEVGSNSGGSGSIDVNGGTLALGTGTLTLGIDGAGSLLVRAGGTVTQTGNTILGLGAGPTASVIITGAGSTMSSANIFVGSKASASLTVQAGGAINATGTGFIGSNNLGTSGGTGTVNLNGGSWTSANGFNIGDSLPLAGTGVVHVYPGGALTASGSSAINLNAGGTLDIAGGAVSAGSISQ